MELTTKVLVCTITTLKTKNQSILYTSSTIDKYPFNFKIYKNGRPNNGWSNNPKEVLKSIPASMIKRIEVITEPGAKYDAEGVSGILNIITDDQSVINGVIGSVSANSNTNDMHGANTYITTQIGKFTTSINYNFSTLGKANTVPFHNGEYNYIESGNRLSFYGENKI
mgnify:CR=1 FL=1